MKRRVLQWVRLPGIEKLSGDAATRGETGKKERGSVSMVHRTGVTVATGTGSPASHAASSYFLPFPFSFIPVYWSLHLSLSLCPALYLPCHFSGNLSLQQFFHHTLHSPLSSSHPTCYFLPLSSFPWAQSLKSSFQVYSCFFCLCVCVGGRGSSSLHASGSAPDPATLQAGGESRQERFPVPQEALS